MRTPRQTEGLGRFTDGKRNVVQAGVGVAHDRQQAVEKQGYDRRRSTDAEQRDHEHEQSQRWNGLNDSHDGENDLPGTR